jgi:hypothetical protein
MGAYEYRNTPAGTNIIVEPLDPCTGTQPVSLTFEEVNEPGTTSVVTSSEGDPPPAEFKLGNPPTYYDVTTTATCSGSIQVCIDYSDVSFVNPADVKLYHFEDTDGNDIPDDWVDCTTSVDPVNHIVCGIVSSLSPFALFEPENQPPVAEAGDDQTVEQDSYAGTEVTLDGSSSTDLDSTPGTNDDIVSFHWYEGATLLGSGQVITYTFPLGSHTVTLTVTDSYGETDSNDVIIIVQDTSPPVVDAGPDITVEQESWDGTTVTLNGSAIDKCDAALDYQWSEDGEVLGTSAALTHTFNLGAHTLTFKATDDSGNVGTDTATVTVVDTTPPTIHSVPASPNILWPPNHKMVGVTVTVDANDICDPAPVCQIVAVTSNEPINGLGDGDTGPDWQITSDLTVNLRAERAGVGTGRVYTIHIECTDASGNTATATVEATVPHNQG